jgi:hypothetical protein
MIRCNEDTNNLTKSGSHGLTNITFGQKGWSTTPNLQFISPSFTSIMFSMGVVKLPIVVLSLLYSNVNT